ncbi:MAG: MBL fold metallo-hydrolase, partial [Clostridia bacterium]
LLTCLLLLGGCASAPAEDARQVVRLVAINVGKADCLLLELGDARYLIDTGTVQSWGSMRAVLAERGVTRLNGVFLTHTDKDHGGGMIDLAQSAIEVDVWYAPRMFADKKMEKHQAVQAARLRGKEVVWLEAGQTLSLSEGMTLDVLSPRVLDEVNENNNSLVMRLQTPEGSMLLTGDMEYDAERVLLASDVPLASDVLKVGHHGENDATSLSFARAVAPKLAVISTNSQEEPDTPDPAIVGMLQTISAQVRITQEAPGGLEVTMAQGVPTVRLLTEKAWPAKANVSIAQVQAGMDTITLQNESQDTVALAGWYLYSSTGDERFDFPAQASLAPGATIQIGSQSTETQVDLRWPDKKVIHRKKTDIFT